MTHKIGYLLYSAGLAAVAATIVGAAEPAGRDGGAAPAAPGGARVQALTPGMGLGVAAQEDPNGTGLVPQRAFTIPSEERDLAFSAPGLVTNVTVKQDEPVKSGQVLAEQDITVEKANKATFEIEANSTVEEEFAVADLDLKKVELARKEQLFKSGRAINQLELDEARLNVKRAEAQVKLAKQKRQTAAAQAAVEQAKIDLKRIISPIDGIVQKLDTHAGEVASNQVEKPALKLVKTDPLWVDVIFPAGTAAKLRPGQPIQVRYTTEQQDKWMQAEVLSLRPVVERGSQTRTVRLVMANPDGTPPGLEVNVKLPDAVAEAAPEAGAGAAAAGANAQAGAGR